jgi:hypothetical protein
MMLTTAYDTPPNVPSERLQIARWRRTLHPSHRHAGVGGNILRLLRRKNILDERDFFVATGSRAV